LTHVNPIKVFGFSKQPSNIINLHDNSKQIHSCSNLEVCRLPHVSNGLVPNTIKEFYKPKDELILTCNAGYAPSSIVTICQSNRIWTPEPICTYVSCTIPRLENGYYTIDGIQSENALPYGSSIYPTCSQSGYTSSHSTARTCQESGTWSGSDPTCITKLNCRSLPLVANGYYDGGSNNLPYPVNQTITLICDDGYYMSGSSDTRTCISNDTWSANDHTCVRITCNDTSHVRHVSITGYPEIGFAEVGTVTFNSSFCHIKEGFIEVNCSADRKLSWINPPEFGRIYLL